MSSNAQKTPFQRSLHEFGDVKSQDWQSRLPKSMPATVTKVSGALVTVKLDGNWAPYSIPEITVPQAGSKYVREDVQVGDKGIVIGVDFYIGGQSGEGGGVANTTPRANLTNAVFQPITQKNFASAPAGVTVVSGTNGAELKDIGNKATLKAGTDGITGTTTEGATLTASKTIILHAGQAFTLQSDTDLTLEVGGVKLEFTTGGIVLTGNVTINGTTTFDGDLTVNGALSATGNIHSDINVTATSNISATGSVTAGTGVTAGTDVTAGANVNAQEVLAVVDVIANSVSLHQHQHIVSTAPGVTGLPFG